jgi:transcriptional regulator with XRE-family HTH domain
MEEKVSIGRRLREERERLGLNQDVLGVTPQSQRKYEKGESTPGADYLANFAAMGGDVLYVITGTRAAGVVSDIEARLINAFRASPEAVRDAIMAALQAGAANAPAAPIAEPVEQLTTEKGAISEDRKALEEKAGIRPRSDAETLRKGRSGGK